MHSTMTLFIVSLRMCSSLEGKLSKVESVPLNLREFDSE